MTSPATAAGKRRSLSHQPTTEDQELNIIAQEAESRLASSHAVLAEARKIRTCERERLRQAKSNEEDEEEEEDEEFEDASEQPNGAGESPGAVMDCGASPPPPNVSAPDVATPVAPPAAAAAPAATKRSSVDDGHTNGTSIRSRLTNTASSQLSTGGDLEEKYKRVMMTNAQLDNDKQVLQYEVELLKDRLVDEEERYQELRHQFTVTGRELTDVKRTVDEWKSKANSLQELLTQRDALIKEHGLLLISVGEPDVIPQSSTGSVSSALLSGESAELLADYEGTLGERLNKFFQEKVRLEAENKQLQRDLETERSRASLAPRYPLPVDGVTAPGSPSIDGPFLDVETQKNVTEYKLKLKRAEQEITTLQGTVTRLECQVTRYKTAAESSEKSEEDLKQERRRLQKELREAQTLIQELETTNSHMTKRLEKAKYRNVTDNN